MKGTILLIFLASTFLAFSSQIKEIQPTVMLEESKRDNQLTKSQAVYKFVFRNISDISESRKMMYSIDGQNETGKLIDNRFLEFKTTPGKHIFQFYYNDMYEEVYTDSIYISPGYRDEYSVYLTQAIYPVMTEKPVIYLYPKEKTDIEFKIDIKGKEHFTYPTYTDSWSFSASPDGTLTFGDDQFNYLFWDAKQHIVLPSVSELDGFVVKKDDIVEFLEEKLILAGLNSKERADFITYWGPKLIAHENVFIRFVFNDDCNQFAEFDITPKPDNVYRIYMQWHPTRADQNVNEQKIIPANRNGFSVIEWGGQQIKLGKLRTNHHPLNLKQ